MKRLIVIIGLLSVGSNARGADVGGLTINTSWSTTWNTSSFNTFTLNASNDKIERIFQCEAACAIDQLGLRYGVRTGTPVELKMSLQGVNSSGNADGTIKGAGNAAYKNFTPPADTTKDELFYWTGTLGASHTCTRGEWLAIVVEPVGTPDGSNNSSWSSGHNNMPSDQTGHYATTDGGVGPTKNANFMSYGYKCSSTVYGRPYESTATTDYAADASYDEQGNVFTLPAGSCDTFKVKGVRFQGYFDCAGSTVDMILYSGTSAQQTLTIDCDLTGAPSSQGNSMLLFSESTLTTLTCGTSYRLIFKPNATTGPKFGLSYLTVRAAEDMNGFPLGTSMYGTRRVDAGAWEDATTRRYYIEPILDDITEPSVGGGAGVMSRFNVGLN